MIIVSGLLMWVGGNGGVNWAEQHVDSGLVALIVGTMPMWVAFAEARIERRRPSGFLLGALGTGFLGLALLPTPIVMTYTYVNPVIAVFLGWLVYREQITVTMLAGMVMILAGVWGVFRDRHQRALEAGI
ncbi:MAG: hypothetical protein DRJ61_18965 [Acidobacteria bacterium]|nr:MAG: hypothetical protein DRJ61_18965 [Acidobacteriota bacterium]RLE25771.1 MAG: hypothetical protein DRJ65_06965 [Acidobacteriota bacterium]